MGVSRLGGEEEALIGSYRVTRGFHPLSVREESEGGLEVGLRWLDGWPRREGDQLSSQ